MLKKILSKYYMRMGLNSIVEKNYVRAKDYFFKQRKVDPHQRGVFYNIAISYYFLKDFKEAEKFLLKELKILFGTENIEEILKRCSKNDSDKNQFTVTLVSLADASFEALDREKALYYYNSLLKINLTTEYRNLADKRIEILQSEEKFNNIPKSREYLEKGQELLKEKKIEEALNNFLKSFEMDPTNTNAGSNIADIYSYHLKDKKKSIEFYRKILEIQRNPGTKYLLERLVEEIDNEQI